MNDEKQGVHHRTITYIFRNMTSLMVYTLKFNHCWQHFTMFTMMEKNGIINDYETKILFPWKKNYTRVKSNCRKPTLRIVYKVRIFGVFVNKTRSCYTTQLQM